MVVNRLKVHPLSKIWFQTSTCTPTPRRGVPPADGTANYILKASARRTASKELNFNPAPPGEEVPRERSNNFKTGLEMPLSSENNLSPAVRRRCRLSDDIRLLTLG